MNLRYELRAYQDPDACRLAALIQELAASSGPMVSRDEVVCLWPGRYPGVTSRSVRQRISKVLSYLRVTGMVEADEATITILNPERLAMAATNLGIIQDSSGMTIRPLQWSRRPTVPEHLLPAQASLETARQAAAKAAQR